MPNIKIDQDVYSHLFKQACSFEATENDVLRRLLNLGPAPASPAPEPDPEPEPTAPPLPRPSPQPIQPVPPRPTPPPNDPTPSPGPGGQGLLSKGELLDNNTALKRFMAILGKIHHEHPDDFHKVGRVTGKKRTYFARTPGEIERSGNSTKPQKIPATGWYVTTNTSTDRKLDMIDQVLELFGYPFAVRLATKKQLASTNDRADFPARSEQPGERPTWPTWLNGHNQPSSRQGMDIRVQPRIEDGEIQI